MSISKYFDSIELLHHYSLEVGRSIQDVVCQVCRSSRAWVSHGFVYKKARGGEKEQVGKRVLCSNRGQRQGCGHTERLYVSERTPRLHYSVTCVFVFMSALVSMSIAQAYFKATGCSSDRNAYRWLHKLDVSTPHHRERIRDLHQASSEASDSRRLQLIADSFSALAATFGSAEAFQVKTQCSFLVS